MSTPFQQPAEGGDRLPDLHEFIGCLILFQVLDHKSGVATPYGEKDPVACDVHVLDGPHGGEVFSNALIFQGGLVGALKGAVGGGPVLARMGLGTAKAGQQAPYILLPFTTQDAAMAGPYWAGVQAKGFQAPAAAAPAQAAPAAAAPAVPTSAPAPAAAPATTISASPAPAGTVDLSSLPKNVQELIRQTIGA